MARKAEATLLLTIKEKGKKALDGIAASLGNVKAVSAIAVTSFTALSAAIGKLAVDASRFEEVKKAFTNLAGSQGQDAQKMLANLKELSAGTISELELMKKANNAILLGLPIDRFDDMLNIARSSAKATGQSMEFMLNSIVTGIGRGSKLMIDNLGIIVDTEKAYEKFAVSLGKTADQLTDAQKKTAFMNEVLRIGTANVEAQGERLVSTADKWDAFKANISNATNVLGAEFIPITGSVITSLDNMLTWSVDIFRRFALGIKVMVVNAEASIDQFIGKAAVFGNVLKKIFTLDWDQIQSELKNGGQALLDIEKKRQDDIIKLVEDHTGKTEKIKIKSAKKTAAELKAVEEQRLKEERDLQLASIQEQLAKEREEAKKNVEEALEFEKEARLQASIQAEQAILEQRKIYNDNAVTFMTGGLQGVAQKTLSSFTESILPGFGGAAGQMFAILSQDTDQFIETVNSLFSAQFLENVLVNIGKFFEMLPGIITNMVNHFSENAPSIIEGLVEAIVASIPELTSALTKAAIKMAVDPRFQAELAAAFAKGLLAGFKDVANDIADTVKKAIKDGVKGLGNIGGSNGTFGLPGIVTGDKSRGPVTGIKGSPFARGGFIPGFARGGSLDDTIIRATPGEFMVNKASSQANRGILEDINNSNGRAVGGGSNVININVQGGLLGDRETARQFALAIDTELVNLRRNNESKAFEAFV